MRKFTHILVILSLVFAPMSYNIAAMLDDLSAIQDCEQSTKNNAQHMDHEQSDTNNDCCCDNSCDSCCSAGFHAAIALLVELSSIGYEFSQIDTSQLSHTVEGQLPVADFRPPISVS